MWGAHGRDNHVKHIFVSLLCVYVKYSWEAVFGDAFGLTADRTEIRGFLSIPWPQVTVSWIKVGENSDQVTSILRSKADRLKNTLLWPYTTRNGLLTSFSIVHANNIGAYCTKIRYMKWYRVTPSTLQTNVQYLSWYLVWSINTGQILHINTHSVLFRENIENYKRVD